MDIAADITVDIAVDIAVSELGYCLQIWPVVPVV